MNIDSVKHKLKVNFILKHGPLLQKGIGYIDATKSCPEGYVGVARKKPNSLIPQSVLIINLNDIHPA